jgi:hypothetical protein
MNIGAQVNFRMVIFMKIYRDDDIFPFLIVGKPRRFQPLVEPPPLIGQVEGSET